MICVSRARSGRISTIHRELAALNQYCSNCSQIIANGTRIIAVEFELGHVGVRPDEMSVSRRSRKLIEMKTSAKRGERRGAFMRAGLQFPGCVGTWAQ